MAESTGQTLEEVSQRPVSEFVQAPYIVPNSKSLSDLLKEFKRTRQQMAVVIDEYGGTEGIITLEDILEEIVGDYEDEFTRQARRVKKLVGSQYEIDASMRVSDLDGLLDFPFPTMTTTLPSPVCSTRGSAACRTSAIRWRWKGGV
jgi:CBS domain containing-hemolysin-like protein